MQKRAEQTRQAILRAAAELIGDGGPEAAGLVEICRGAGVSRGALYHHFAAKEDVAVRVRDQARRRTTALVDEAFTADPADPSEDAVLAALSRFTAGLGKALGDEPVVRAGLRLDPDGSADPSRRLRQEVLDSVHHRLRGLLSSAAPADRAAEPQDLADLAVAVVAGLESLGRAEADWWSPATSERIWRTLRPLFPPPEPPTDGAPVPAAARAVAEVDAGV
ncbi:TetR family transcriptional regulator [Streptomyces sp. NPDC016675]|uniref:TetR family transcriptional regulator n=1 Tax=Streptomyces sp. NPDC016675 TaxID=3364970 RepID=UPI0036F83BB5